MAEAPLKPILQKPPGYKDQNPDVIPVPRTLIKKPLLPQSRNQKKNNRRSCRRRCCCFLCILVLTLIVAIIAGGGVFYLWFDPKLPVFHLQSFRISQFNVTDKLDGTYLTVKTISRIEVRNPNGKLALNYGDIEVDVGAGDGTGLGSETVSGFIQVKESVTSLKVETGVSNELVDGGTGRKLQSGYRSKEMVVRVAARAKVGVVVGNRKVVPVKVKVECGGVSLKSLERGDMPKCSIQLRKWLL